MANRVPIALSLFKWIGFGFFVLMLLFYVTNQEDNTSSLWRNRVKILNENEVESENESYSETTNLDDAEDAKLPLYFVESSKCKIPYIDPFSDETMAVYKPMVFETCSNDSALVSPIYDQSRRRYVLHINETVATLLLNSSEIEYNCYYQEVVRDAPHDSYERMERKYFSQDYVVPLHVQGIILACHRIDNTSYILQNDAYSLIQYMPPPKGLSSEPGQRKPSVIMFGIDSLSKINLRRTMPKVYNFLTRSGWYEMQGYNKIGDNTFPNLLAILTGYTPDTLKEHICDWETKGCFDRSPFIWKDFNNASYLTAMGEDESGMNTFNYVKPGFLEQPTDYYLRPFQKAIDRNMDTWKCEECSLKYCIGRRITSSYVYDFGAEFARRYVDERPIFGLFWSNSFSHDDYSMPSKMQDYVLQYLLNFETDGVFEQSIVIFLSDHGARYGRIMSFASGFLESRLPTMFIYLPPWFRSHYPAYAQALHGNQNRLTSNYDLHNTLKHIIELGGTPDGPSLTRSFDCPKCQSLFYAVDEVRSCEDAGIPEHYCTCVPYKTIAAHWAERIAPRVIERINEYLMAKNLSSICSKLSLNYVHNTEIKIDLDQNYHEDLPVRELAVYRTKFKVKQNSADFHATVKFNNITETVEVDVETISRTNSYEEDSTCVNDKMAKLYCICISNLKD